MENTNKKETIFVDGLHVSKPHPNSPDFIKLEFGAKVDDLVAFLQEHKKEDGWLNFTLKKSQGGKLYLELNTWKKEPTTEPPVEEPQEEIKPAEIF